MVVGYLVRVIDSRDVRRNGLLASPLVPRYGHYQNSLSAMGPTANSVGSLVRSDPDIVRTQRFTAQLMGQFFLST
jgi:hypothetical protein